MCRDVYPTNYTCFEYNVVTKRPICYVVVNFLNVIYFVSLFNYNQNKFSELFCTFTSNSGIVRFVDRHLYTINLVQGALHSCHFIPSLNVFIHVCSHLTCSWKSVTGFISINRPPKTIVLNSE